MSEINHAGLGSAWLRSHMDTPLNHAPGAPCGYCGTADETQPRTVAGQHLIADMPSWPAWDDPIFARFVATSIRRIEVEAVERWLNATRDPSGALVFGGEKGNRPPPPPPKERG